MLARPTPVERLTSGRPMPSSVTPTEIWCSPTPTTISSFRHRLCFNASFTLLHDPIQLLRGRRRRVGRQVVRLHG
jgi:hypothetical protein